MSGLNELQIGLLRMFERNVPDDDIREIKRVLVKHLSQQMLNEVDAVMTNFLSIKLLNQSYLSG